MEEENLVKIKGGAYYYDFEGKRLGTIGNSSKLYFVDKSTYDQFKAFNIEVFGTSFKDVSESTKIAFIKNFFPGADVSIFSIEEVNSIAYIDLFNGALYFSSDFFYVEKL